MYILDTDHLSVLERGGYKSEHLRQQLSKVDPTQVKTTIISYEEQVRGRLDYVKSKAKTIEQQVVAYQRLNQHLNVYCRMDVLDFTQPAVEEFRRLRKMYRVGSMDLKIASIALITDATVLTRNQADFGKIEGLAIEDWT